MPSNDRDATSPRALANDGETRFGGYRLVRRLGVGGMAEVWSAEAAGGRPVAIKRILPHLCDDLAIVEMFLSEARLTTLLKHQNVVRTYEVGIHERQPFIAMELVSGVDLRKLSAASTEPLPIGLCLAVAIDVCDALAYVHAARDRDGSALGLIHRDISHSNVMLTRDGGLAKLLDFGVAKAALTSGLSRTRTGELKGKLGYMAPELLKEERYDHRADLFSIGVVLYELLVLQRLFKASTEASMLMMNLACHVAAPSTLRPELPAALDGVVLRALSADPARRYGSAGEMADALRGLARDYRWSPAQTVALIAERLPAGAPSRDQPLTAPLAQARSERAAVAPAASELTRVAARPPTARSRFVAAALAFVAATGLMLLVIMLVRGRGGSSAPVEVATTAAPRSLPPRLDPWAPQPRLDVVSNGELTLPLPTADVAPPPRTLAESAPPPMVTATDKPAPKRPSAATRPVSERAHKTPTARHRHQATETLMGQKELMNPLAQ